MADSIIGFRTKVSVNDGASDAEQFFTKAMTVNLPAREIGEYEEKVLNTANKNRTYRPTLIDNGTVTVEGYFSKTEYARLVALLGIEGKTWKLYSPDEDGATATVTPGVYTLAGFLKKIGEAKFEKDKEVSVSFELRVNSVTVADGSNDSSFPTA
jgi:hypothetical protein